MLFCLFLSDLDQMMCRSQEDVGVDVEVKSEEDLGILLKIRLRLHIRIPPYGPAGGRIYLVMLSAPTGSDIITCSALHS